MWASPRGWRSLSRICMPGKAEQLLRRSTQLEGSQCSQACGQGRLWSGVTTHPFRWGPRRWGSGSVNNVSLCSWLIQLHLTPFLRLPQQITSSGPKQPRCHTLSTSELSDMTQLGTGVYVSGPGVWSLGIRAGPSAEHSHKHPSSLPLSQHSFFVQSL